MPASAPSREYSTCRLLFTTFQETLGGVRGLPDGYSRDTHIRTAFEPWQGNSVMDEVVYEGPTAQSAYYALNMVPGVNGRIVVPYAGGLECHGETTAEDFTRFVAFWAKIVQEIEALLRQPSLQ